MAGINVREFMTLKDPAEVLAMQAVAARVLKLDEERDKRLAILIRNQIAEAFG